MKNKSFFADYVTNHPWTIKTSERSPSSLESVFPVIYHTDANEFEISSGLDVLRKEKIWGYEIAPNIIMAKDNYECDWEQMKFLAKKFKMGNKEGKLLPIERLVSMFNSNFHVKICEMTRLLHENEIDASDSGEIYSHSDINGIYVWTYGLSSGFKQSCCIRESLEKRLIVTF